MKYIIFGISGKMGQKIKKIAEKKGYELIKGFSSEDSLDVDVRADVAIDFSHADYFDDVLSFCVTKKLPLVSGTTGLKEKHFLNLDEASKIIPILWASNTSLGVQVIRNMLNNITPIKDWDVHIHESHHINKKDSPSGTATTIAEDIKEITKKDEVAISAARGGGIFGEHEISIMGDSEIIRIQHIALSRDLFAEGAISAAEFLKDKKPAQYQMKDLFGLE